MTAGQVERYAAGPLAHPAADLDQAQTQGAQMEACSTGLAEPALEGIEQPVGCGMQQQAKLISPEAMATESVSKAPFSDR